MACITYTPRVLVRVLLLGTLGLLLLCLVSCLSGRTGGSGSGGGGGDGLVGGDDDDAGGGGDDDDLVGGDDDDAAGDDDDAAGDDDDAAGDDDDGSGSGGSCGTITLSTADTTTCNETWSETLSAGTVNLHASVGYCGSSNCWVSAASGQVMVAPGMLFVSVAELDCTVVGARATITDYTGIETASIHLFDQQAQDLGSSYNSTVASEEVLEVSNSSPVAIVGVSGCETVITQIELIQDPSDPM